MRLVLHGTLREQFGESVTMNAAASIADAIEGVSSQLKDWPRKLALDVVGYPTIDSLKNNTPDEVHLMPSMQGGSSKVINFVLGAALVIVGVALLFIPGGQAIGISLIVSGSLMIIQGIIQLFMKAPTLDQEENPDDSKYLGLNQNTTATRTPITMAWGRVKLYPHWLSLQADSSNMVHGTFPVTPT